VRPLEFPLFADENIHPDVVSALREQGRDVTTVVEAGLGGADDVSVLRHAFAEGRVVCTHDSDFGSLAFQGEEPFIGIIYLRPGHIDARFVLEIIDAVESTAGEAEPPFLLVAARAEDCVRVRLRSAVGSE
jgi:predicted nuclease of predicted toxin-antitoxin system